MKNRLRFLLSGALLLFGLTPSWGQELISCGTHLNEAQLPRDQRAFLEKVELQTQEYIRQQTAAQSASGQAAKLMGGGGTGPIVIPVVFHIIYNNSYAPAQNISDQVVYDQLQILNDDFARRNADQSQTLPDHQGVAANTGIQFQLAAYDPQGTCTTGIMHVSTTHTMFAVDSEPDAMKHYAIQTTNGLNGGGADAWDPAHYLNIWVCELHPPTVPGYPDYFVPGYTIFPTERAIATATGIVMDYRFIGTSYAPNEQGRILTQQAGHFLNLHHIFGDYRFTIVPVSLNCASDRVSDTPPVEGTPHHPYPSKTIDGYTVAFNDCVATRTSTCGAPQPNLDMYENYMSISPGSCQNMFTQGQALRMQACLAPGGVYNSLTNSASAFYPQPVISTTVPPSFCNTAGVEIEVVPPQVCGNTSHVTSFTFSVDVVDGNTYFPGGAHDSKTLLYPQEGNVMHLLMEKGEWVKNLSVVANFSDGTSSLPTVQPIRMHQGAPSNTLPGTGTITTFQEMDNSCFFGLTIPIIGDADVYDVAYTLASNGVTGGASKNIPAADYRLTPGSLNLLAGIFGSTIYNNEVATVTLKARNACGQTIVGTFIVPIPQVAPNCLNQYTNRATAPAPITVTLSPNPAMQEVTLNSAQAAGFTSGLIRTTMGMIVKSFHVSSESPVIRLDDVKPGLYIVELQGKTGVERHQLSIGTL